MKPARADTSLLLSVYLPSLVMAFGRGLLLPVLPLFADSFGASYALVGLVLAGESIGMLLADLPAGSLLRRLRPRLAMVLGVLLVGAAAFGLFWVSSLWQALLVQIASGMGGALWNVSRHAYLTTATQPEQRGRAISFFGGVTRMGIFAGPGVGGLLAASFGLRAPFLLVAGLAALTAVLAGLFTEDPARSPELPLAHRSSLALFRDYRGILLSAGLGQLFAQMIRAARFALIPLYGSNVIGLGVDAVGWLMSASSLIDMMMFYPAGLVMDRFGRKAAIVPSFAVQGLGMLLMPLSTSFLGLLAVASLIGLANGLSSGSMMTLGADLAPRESLGEFLGLWRLVGDSGSTGGPVAVGVVAAALSLGSSALVLGGVGLLAAAIFAFGVPETLRREGRLGPTP